MAFIQLAGAALTPTRRANSPLRSLRRHTQLRYHAAPLRRAKPILLSLDTNTKIDPASTDLLLSTIESTPLPLPQAMIDDMVVHLGDSRGMARLGLVDNFGRVGSVAVPSLLNGIKSSPDPVVRRSCGKALAKIGDASATPVLLHTLVNDDDRVTRSSAAGALARMGATSVPSLLELISNPDVSMTAKGHAAWAIAFMQGEAAETLFAQLNNTNKDVRIAVINALGAIAIGDALPTMAGASVEEWTAEDDQEQDGDTADQKVCKRAIAGLRNALGDIDSEVRAEAAIALANAACIEEAPRIARLLDDSDAEMRRCAALSLMKLGDVSFIDVLQAKSEDTNDSDDVRKVAKLAADTLRRKVEEEEEDEWDD